MKRFLKFICVGASGIVVNQGLLWFFTEIIGFYYLISAAIAIETSIVTNFILNEKWTFRDRSKGKKGMFRRGIKFNTVSVAGLVINISVLFFCTEALGIYYLISNLIGIVAAFLWNYFVNLGWTWKEEIRPAATRKVRMVSMITPTYNERENIKKLIPMIVHTLRKAGIRCEVVVVDDNSPDGTAEAAREMGRKFPVRVIKRKGKLGLSSAVIEGFRTARGDVLGVIDADLQHPVDVLPEMVKAIGRYEMVVGSRHVPGGGSEDWPLRRRLISRIAILMAKPVTKLRDTTSGYFMVRRDALERAGLNPKGFKICLEVAVKSGATLKEVPIIFRKRESGKSKLGGDVAWDYILHLKDLYRYRLGRML